MLDYFYDTIDILGTFAFAVAGSMAAIRKRLDMFGILIIAFVTSIGGGTLRDVLLGRTPVGWLSNHLTIGVIVGSTVLAILFRNYLNRIQYPIRAFDALGLGLYTLTGIQVGLSMHFSIWICIALGTITGCFGGVIRDTLLNEIPLLFQKEIYALASIMGGLVYFLLTWFKVNDTAAQILCILLIFAIRMIAVRRHWSLPSLEG